MPLPPDVPARTPLPSETRLWAVFLHLAGLSHYLIPVPGAGVVLPLILWQVKKDDSAFLDQQGREALNFQISILIYVVVSAILVFALVGIVLLPAVLLFQLVACVMAAIRANEGRVFRYPLCLRLV
ncbi:MAG: DUF4870 domain-containing protein [Planctomycetes bacterium]|nr:DUF4870 domain-containing protein [Planctomycetota bacterium]